ncbi:MAG: hypothetical protein S4CHLAM102_01630 [Chlamydiia bacterium]|nr:hypothetical protein [Chlamydiia bacterium]
MATFPEVFHNHMLNRVDGPEPVDLIQERLGLAARVSVHLVAIQVITAFRDASLEYFDVDHSTCFLNTRQLICIGAAIATLAVLPVGLAEIPVRLIQGIVLAIMSTDIKDAILPAIPVIFMVCSVINLPEIIGVNGRTYDYKF